MAAITDPNKAQIPTFMINLPAASGASLGKVMSYPRIFAHEYLMHKENCWVATALNVSGLGVVVGLALAGWCAVSAIVNHSRGNDWEFKAARSNMGNWLFAAIPFVGLFKIWGPRF